MQPFSIERQRNQRRIDKDIGTDLSVAWIWRPFQQQNVAGTINVNYVGDDGQRLLQVSGSRQIAVNDSGRDIFLRNSAGNGSFVTGAAAANTGTGIVDPGSVVTPQNWTGHNYTLTFTSATTFDVTDTTTSTTVATGVSYTNLITMLIEGVLR